jgi:hypothetical protein
MFLTNPTIEELQALDMPVLLDMLTYQTVLHSKLSKLDGVSGTAGASEELVTNIQTAIEFKRKAEKNSTATASDISFTKDITAVDRPKN